MTTSTRAAELAAEFEAAQDEFIALLESLTDDQWRAKGTNYPTQMNNEDEGRSVAVIAHHVASTGPFTMGRIQDTLAGRTLTPVNITQMSADHARENRDCSRNEVLSLLRESKPKIADAIRPIPDDRLDQAMPTPTGAQMTIAFRIQAILTGHIKMHQGSIEQAIGR